MFPAGIVFTCFGGIIILFGLSSGMAAPGGTTVNLGLIADRIVYVLFGGFVFLWGCIFMAAGALCGRLEAIKKALDLIPPNALNSSSPKRQPSPVTEQPSAPKPALGPHLLSEAKSAPAIEPIPVHSVSSATPKKASPTAITFATLILLGVFGLILYSIIANATEIGAVFARWF